MSVAIDSTAAAQANKNEYDSEFDTATSVAEFDEDLLGPAKMCWFTCGLSCGLTG